MNGSAEEQDSHPLQFEHDDERDHNHKVQFKDRCFNAVSRKTVILALLGLLLIVLAFVVGYFARRSLEKGKCNKQMSKGMVKSLDERTKIWEIIMKNIDPSQIDANSK